MSTNNGDNDEFLMCMISCPDCESLVPSNNLELHRLRACTVVRDYNMNGNGYSGDRQHRRTTSPSVNIATTTNVTTDDSKNDRVIMKSPSQSHGNNSDDVAMDSDDNNSNETNEIIDLINETPPASVRRVDDTSNDSNTRMVDLTRVHVMDDISNVSQARAIDLTGINNEVNGGDNSDNDRKLPARDSTTNTDSNTDDSNDNQWSCPQCTLLNPNTATTCDACQYRNPINRFYGQQESSTSPLRYIQSVGSGAILGAAMGATGNWIQGRDPLSGALEGGSTGAVGGAILHEVFQNNNDNNESSRTSVAEGANDAGYNHIESFTSTRHTQGSVQNTNFTDVAAVRISGYPSMNATNVDTMPFNSNNPATSRLIRQRPRASYSVRTDNSNGNEVTVISGGNSTTRIARRRSNNAIRIDPAHRTSNANIGSRGRTSDPLMDLLLHHHLHMNSSRYRTSSGRTNGGTELRSAQDIDTMNYDQLLNAFGDGTENLGASEGDIRQLPTYILKDDPQQGPSALPEDARQCLICLEDFTKGDSRTILPCIHGFHTNCSTKWLRTKGACPICKHRITQST